MIATVDLLPRINPKEITNLNRTQAEKEKFLLFCVLCAGKSSDVMAEKLEGLLSEAHYNERPFEYLTSGIFEYEWRCESDHEPLLNLLKKHKIGKYKLLIDFFWFLRVEARGYVSEFVDWSRDGLVQAPGISYKTASLYRMHCFGDRLACLDTHVLRWLRLSGFRGVPKASPSNWDTYRHWENVFLGECYKRDVEPNHLDLNLWKQATKKSPSARL